MDSVRGWSIMMLAVMAVVCALHYVDAAAWLPDLSELALMPAIFLAMAMLWLPRITRRFQTSLPFAGAAVSASITALMAGPTATALTNSVLFTSVMALLIICIAQRLSLTTSRFESALFDLGLLNDGRNIPSVEENTRQIDPLLLLSRRHERPLSCIVVEAAPLSLSDSLQRFIHTIETSARRRYSGVLLGRLVDGLLRRTDVLFKTPHPNRFVLVCPETDEDTSKLLAGRIQDAALEQLNVSVRIGIASFPSDAPTFHELIDRAETHLAAAGDANIRQLRPQSQSGPQQRSAS